VSFYKRLKIKFDNRFKSFSERFKNFAFQNNIKALLALEFALLREITENSQNKFIKFFIKLLTVNLFLL
jgi:hypothetical protein